MLTRRPAPRPWDVIALEVLLTVACAIQVGLLLWLAVATWHDRGAGGVVLGVLVVVAFAVGGGWLLWLLGMNGWLLAGASGVAALEVALLLVLDLAGGIASVSRGALLLGLGLAVLGVLCGIFLPAPTTRRHASSPRVRDSAGGPPSAARVSPGVAAAVDRYGRSVAGGVALITAAGARRLSRGGDASPSQTGFSAGVDDGAPPAAVMQPRPGTPIRTTGPVDAGGSSSVPAASATAPTARGAATEPGPIPPGDPGRPTATTPSVMPGSSSDTASVDGPAAARNPSARGSSVQDASAVAPGTPASGVPQASGRGASPRAAGASPRAAGPPPDPGAIARQARASIDAELARSRPPVRPPPSPDDGSRGDPR